MRVLWFEVTEPARYNASGKPIGGWQDSLESIVRKCPEIKLCVSFMSENSTETHIVDGVIYRPIYSKYSFREKYFKKHWDVYVEKMLPTAKKIINEFQPDVIHIFGTEWPFGQVAKYTNIPVVIHIQGAIVPYKNVNYPPQYSLMDQLMLCGLNLKKIYSALKKLMDTENREKWEKDTWHRVSNFMGRTDWDKALSNIMHPHRNYFHVEEALRPNFTNGKKEWNGLNNKKIKLISTGCNSLRKGPDMLLKTAKVLTELKIDFEWVVAGRMPDDLREMVERKEKAKFVDCHVKILGYIQPDKLSELLISSTMYVHTSYMENSPNSICEAQCLGVPVVSTNVGGISTLVRNGIDGILVPANDPWQMANAILELSKDTVRLIQYSKNSQEIAKERHNPKSILKQLLDCYNTVIKSHQ